MRIYVPSRSSSRLIGRAGRADVVIAPGRREPRTSARLIRRDEIVRSQELSALSEVTTGLLARWVRDAEADRTRLAGLRSRELLAGPLLVELLQALKVALIVARAIERASGARPSLVAPRGWLAFEDALDGLDPCPVVERIADVGRRPILRAGPGFWLRARGWRAPRAAPAGAALPAEPRRGALLAVVNYRNGALLDELEAAGLPVLRLHASSENAYLAAHAVGANAVRGVAEAIADLETFPDDLDRRLPEAPGFRPSRLVRRMLARRAEEQAPALAARALGWARLLEERRCAGVLGAMPWNGDPRLLALVSQGCDLPYVAVQDGALSGVGVGGLLPEASALAWGPAGKAWFERRGFPPARVLAVGDPYLDRWAERAKGLNRAAIRRALELPEDERVLLYALQNSAPHALVYESDDPLLALERVASAVARAPGWRLAVKPHPRLARVDGVSRLAESWIVARRHGARLLSPGLDAASAVAAADAYLSEGDTLTLEALSASRPALLWSPEGHTPPYPDFLDAGLRRVRSEDELVATLAGPEPPSAQALLDTHLASEYRPVDAVRRLVDGL